MRKKSLRLLSFALAATLVASSINPGGVVLATGIDDGVPVQQEELSSEETTQSSEELSEEVTEADNTQQMTEEETAAEVTTEEKTEAVTEEKTTEKGEESDTSEESVEEELLEEQIESKMVDASALVKNLITDAVLFQMVLNAYNSAEGTTKTAADFTYADLSAYTGALNFSSGNAASVKSVAGLGSAKKASSIDMSRLTGVTEIAAKEFQGCEMTSVNLPVNLKKIGEQAFESCVKLTEINVGTKKNTLPGSLTEVGQKAFSNCSSLKAMTLPSFTAGGTILQNSTSLFAGCSQMEKIVIGSGIQTIPVSAFSGAGSGSDTGVSLEFETGSKLDKILGTAFAGMKFADKGKLDLSACTKLASIADGAFDGAKNLKEVILPGSLTKLELGSNAFARTELTTMRPETIIYTGIYLPDYVISIGAGCFYGNTAMKQISLSPNLPAIRDYTFDGCTALAIVIQRQTSGNCMVKEIGDCAFRGTAIPDTDFLMKMNQLQVIGYQELTVCGVGRNNKDKVASPGLGGEDTNVTNAETHEKEYTKNNRIKPCGSEVFTNCPSLTEVNIPASVRKIGSRAFYDANVDNGDGKELYEDITTNSQIETVTWASGGAAAERRICAEAFYNCQSMKTMVLPENKNIGDTLYIDAYAFCNAKSLTSIGTAAGNNVFPVTLQAIDKAAFEFCLSLPSVTIQNTEKGKCPQLAKKVFQHCTSLASAVLPNTITEVPDYFFYNAPVATFQAGTAIERFGTLSFVGNQFVTLDLSNYAGLKEIGSGAFANYDGIVDNQDWDKLGKISALVGRPGDTTCNDGGKLQTVILPAKLSGDNTLFINSAAFDSQIVLTTMKTPSAGQMGQIYIPDYIPKMGTGVFGETAVSRVIWQADATGKNQWEDIPPQMFEFCSNIAKAEDVLPTGNYVKTLGKRLFFGSTIKSVDISHYKALWVIGSGSVPQNANKEPGAFEKCLSLTSVKLPAEASFGLEEKTFYGDVALGTEGGTIDLGGATLIGNEGMAGCTGMTKITFPASLKEIKKQAFLNCSALETVEFGSLEKMGESAFRNCAKLTLTKKGLSDSLTEIGQYAFMVDTNNKPAVGSIGTVSFGPNLKSIGQSAFQRSGVTKVNFTRAKNLEKIGNAAFANNDQLKEFTISGTKVKEIGNDTLKECGTLDKVELGDEILYVNKNALAKCPKFRAFTFASTTTISNEVFYDKGDDKHAATAQELSTPGKISITVVTPEETLVPIGRTFYFPYYVNQKGKSKFDYILVGNASSPATIDQHLKVTANLLDGYYKQRQSNEEGNKYKITDEAYYEKVEPAPSMTLAAFRQEIDTIQMEGLKPTNGTIDFRVVCSINFSCQEEGVSITADKFEAKYNLRVEDIPLAVMLYEDNDRTIAIPEGQMKTVQAVNTSKGAFRCYYDVQDAKPTSSTPDTYDIVVETSNPDVIYPGSGSSASKPKVDENGKYTYTVSVTKKDSNGNITGDKNRQNFYLVPSGIGTAEVTIYPKGYPQYPQKYTFNVNSDIQSIKLAAPREYSSYANPGATFSVFSEYKNYFNQTASVKDMSKFTQYSNKKITFTSDNPDYVTVNQQGVVKVLKADAAAKQVKITAKAPTSVPGKFVMATVTLRVKYADTKMNENVVDPTTGATVAATKVSSKDLEGEAKFVKPQNTSTATVNIPDTVMINGVKYKVTSVSANAFKNNAKLKTVKLGKYVKTIENNAFYGCKVLSKVTFSSSLERIGKKAFYNCKKLKTVVVPKKSALTEIGDYAFYNCVIMTKITIPAKVRSIGIKAFCNCKKLKSITIKSTALTTVGKNALKNIHKRAVIKVPKKKLAAYKSLLKGKGQKRTVKIKK